MERLTDTHHMFWERRDYRRKPLSYLRGLVVARNVLVVAHRDLHANMQPPPELDHSTAYNLYNHLTEQQFHEPLDPAFHAVEYLTDVARPDSLNVASHLIEQIGFIRGSYEA